eukprot:482947-Prymnesium_polylepis.1
MLDVWKPEPGRFRDGGVNSRSVYEHPQHTLSTLSTVRLPPPGRHTCHTGGRRGATSGAHHRG